MKTQNYELEVGLMKVRAKKRRRKLIVSLLLWVFCIWGLLYRMYGICSVHGSSMRPAFCSGDVLFYRRGIHQELQYGDVVIIDSKLDGMYVKRIVGIPGDMIEVNERGYLTRNGEQIEEPEVRYGNQMTDYDTVIFPYVVPEGEYFYLGDNRGVSLDSRILGSTRQQNIKGTVIGLIRLGQHPER